MDEHYMKIALEEAQKAYEKGEVPVGAVMIHEGNIISQAHNQPISLNDPTAHAEILALRQAAKKLGNYRLTGCTLYVTIEPCLMCTGAMLNARIDCLVFGALDPKGGAIFSRYSLKENGGMDYPLNITQGVLKEECGEIIQRFFRERRVGAYGNTPLLNRLKNKGEVPKWS
ncbi:MAG: tRNA adenosine(34) deaminase TadA [Proteobacteria bacterium]|nr:tRNA adenosine(34) deaminase TadA [Pseudomonadota bacterium]